MLDREPSVAIMSNRNELKVYDGNVVYLNNGDNFELKFFNPLQEKIGVEIIFNGVKKGDSYLVLNPGQDVLLDRFLDEQRKMLFETYNINANNKEALEAIEKNGEITFNFYKENKSYYHNDNEIDISYNFPPKPNKNKWWDNKNSRIYTAGSFNGSGSSGSSGVNGASGHSGTGGGSGQAYFSRSATFKSPGTTTGEYDLSYTNTSTYNLNEDYATLSNTNGMGSTLTSSFDSLETGRVESGDYSDQSLRTVNANFSINAFKTINYKILPYSAMNRSIKEVRQYCNCCGYRIRKNSWSYCPKCGERLV
jgi:hypothetical protein